MVVEGIMSVNLMFKMLNYHCWMYFIVLVIFIYFYIPSLYPLFPLNNLCKRDAAAALP